MPHPDRPPFQDPDLPADLRTADLLDRLTTKERIGLLHQYQAPIPRLGVQPFRTGTEALHGLAWLGRATVFPQGPAGIPLRVEFQLSETGLLSVRAWEPESGRRVEFDIRVGGMSEEGVEQARNAVGMIRTSG